MFTIFFFFFFFPQPAMSVPHNNLTDLESLISFKAHVTDPSGLLAANWTTNVSFCSWAGVRCRSHERQRVVALSLANSSLQGTISPLLSNLSFLSHLDLSNNTLTGPIPHAIGRLRRLAHLDLCHNFLSGPIPPALFNMSSLADIYLCHNNLTGTLPSSSSSSSSRLPLLRRISLAYNQLTGSIPPSFARSSVNIEQLDLSANGFTGSIPGETIGNLSKLSLLDFDGNLLGGKLPTSLGNLSNLVRLDMSFNDLDGEIPQELGNLRHLRYLNLGINRLHGPIPVELLNASDLDFLQLCDNELVGPMPDTFGKSLPRLTILNMRQNRLTGGLDFITSLSNCRDLVYLILSGNKLEGVLPDSIGNLSSSHLQYFRIQNNTIKGKIPAGLGNLSSLILLDLEGTEITGELPSALARLERLQAMYLGHARISGSIPSELGSMTSVAAVFLEDNMLSGAIPDSFGNISGLQYLSLAVNNLSAAIPNSLWSLRGLVELDLGANALNGSLPRQVSALESLDVLDLAENRLSGKIPNSLQGLQMLTRLDLSSNSFRGELPESLGGLISVEYLNLSYNLLSGVVPKSLANLKYLSRLDLSFNRLEGRVPEGGVFSNASNSSLLGNVALCGAPRLGLSPCPSIVTASVPKTKLHLLKYILPPVACILLLACFFLILIFRWKKHHEAKCSPSNDEAWNNLRVISHHELIRATDNFSDANLLGRGAVSSVFKARLDDGLLAAVKVLNGEIVGGSRSFDVECRALSVVRHRNLVKIISTCYSQNFKALVLQLMPNGSLENQLYSGSNLNLLQRINVMVDVALALEYLHHDHPQVVVHRDLKPSNVLLDEDMVAHVGDFGISKLMLGGADSTSHLSTCMPGTIGYIAPEYGSTANASTAGDVYSFGILMLETFTRKRPSDPMFDGELSLRQWVSRAYPVAVSEVVDCDLLREAEEQPELLANAHHSFLSSILGLGLRCSRDLPKERVTMRDVVPILRNIKMEYSSSLHVELEAKN